ncbi:MAG: hypothetical protein ACLFSQ_01500 [Candidatus Zixiibacteriota bacterium]
MNRKNIVPLTLFIFLILIAGCKDHGIEPLGSTVYGTVVFEGEWPDNITNAFVVLAKDRPPDDALDLSYLVAFENIPFEEEPVSYDYEIQPDERGRYNWLFVAAIGNADSVDQRNVLTQYTEPDDPDEAGQVVIENDNFYAGTLYVNFDEVYIP